MHLYEHLMEKQIVKMPFEPLESMEAFLSIYRYIRRGLLWSSGSALVSRVKVREIDTALGQVSLKISPH